MQTALLPIEPPHNRRWFYLAVSAVVAFLLYATCQGCNPINKATQQVLTNAQAFNKVGAAWAKLNPCVTDSVKTLVHDTTVKTDTAWGLLPGVPLLQPAVETRQPGTDSSSKPPFRGWGYITKTITLHDSVKIVSVDERQLGICNDSVVYYKVLFANYKQGAIQQVEGWKHKARTRLWVIIAIMAALAAYIFRKPLLSLATGGLTQLLTKKL